MAEINRQDVFDEGIFEDIEKFKTGMKETEASTKMLLSTLRELIRTTQQTSQNISQADNTRRVREESEKLSVAERQLVNIKRQIEAANARQNASYQAQERELIKIRTVQNDRLKQIRQEARDAAGLTGAYQKLTRELADARAAYKNLAASGTATAKELKAQERIVQGLDARVKRIDSTVGQFQRNVGNYPKGFASITTAIKGFVGAFGLIEGIRLGADFVRDAKRIATEAKGVEFAFKQLGDRGQDAFSRIKQSTRGLLSDIEIKKSLNEFENFNISLQETDTLFEFLAVRAAQTGKSVDELKSSLVEGLSKESKLRIDNLGISAAALNEELKRTPNFVQAVANIAKIEVAKAGSILDEAASSQEKWNAALENFKLAIGTRIIEGASSALADFGTSLIKLITPTRDATKAIREEQEQLNTLATRIMMTNSNQEKRIALINQLKTDYPNLLGNIEAEKLSNEQLATALDAANKQYILKIALARQSQRIEEQAAKVGETADRLARSKIEIARLVGIANREGANLTIDANESVESSLRKVQQAYDDGRLSRELYERLSIELDMESRRLNESLREQEAFLAALRSEYNTLSEQIAAILGIQGVLTKKTQNQTNAIGDQTKVIDKNSAAWKEYVKQWDEFYLKLDGRDYINELKKSFDDTDAAMQEALKTVENLDKEFFNFSTSIDYIPEVSEDATEEIKRGWDDAANKIAATKEVIAESFATLSQISDAATERRIANIDSEIAKMTEQKDRAISLYEEGTDARANAEKAYNARIEALEKRKVQAQRRQAIFNKALSVAQIYIKTREAVMTTQAQLGAVAAAPFIPIIIANGAAQAAAALAQPIPAYAEGTESAKKGLGLWGEAGPEIKQDRHGNLEIATKPTISKFEGGEKVFDTKETMKMIAAGMLNFYETRKSNDEQYLKDIKTGISNLNKTIKKRPVYRGEGSYQVGQTRLRKLNQLRNR